MLPRGGGWDRASVLHEHELTSDLVPEKAQAMSQSVGKPLIEGWLTKQASSTAHRLPCAPLTRVTRIPSYKYVCDIHTIYTHHVFINNLTWVQGSFQYASRRPKPFLPHFRKDARSYSLIPFLGCSFNRSDAILTDVLCKGFPWNWKKRYCELDQEGTLRYFTSHKGSSTRVLKGAIKVPGGRIYSTFDTNPFWPHFNKSNGFQVVDTKGRVLLCVAQTANEHSRWVRILKQKSSPNYDSKPDSDAPSASQTKVDSGTTPPVTPETKSSVTPVKVQNGIAQVAIPGGYITLSLNVLAGLIAILQPRRFTSGTLSISYQFAGSPFTAAYFDISAGGGRPTS